MILTNRDTRLLLKLQNHAILTTRQLASIIFPGIAITTVLRRLRALEKGGYVQRIEGLPSTERAWGMTEQAADLYPDRPSKIHFPRHSLHHDLKLTDIRILLEGSGVALSWIPEHEIRTKIAKAHGIREAQRKVIPDAIVGIEARGFKESIALELELNFKNSKRYRQIFFDYREKKNLYAVWYVVGSKAIGRHLAKCYKQSYFAGHRPYLFWSALEDVMCDPITAKLWCENAEYSVGQIFQKKPIAPAHPPAQGLSRLDGEMNSENMNSNTENNSEKIKPAS